MYEELAYKIIMHSGCHALAGMHKNKSNGGIGVSQSANSCLTTANRADLVAYDRI